MHASPALARMLQAAEALPTQPEDVSLPLDEDRKTAVLAAGFDKQGGFLEWFLECHPRRPARLPAACLHPRSLRLAAS